MLSVVFEEVLLLCARNSWPIPLVFLWTF